MKDILDKQIEELKFKQQLLDEFPDLEEYENRWNTKFLISKKANSLCQDYYLKNSCGCCEDSIIYLTPYIVRGNFKIYSNPCQITIGENCYGGGKRSYNVDLNTYGLNKNLIENLKKVTEDWKLDED